MNQDDSQCIYEEMSNDDIEMHEEPNPVAEIVPQTVQLPLRLTDEEEKKSLEQSYESYEHVVSEV